MLKRFAVENFSSFFKESVLDLTAGRPESNPEHIHKFRNVKLLKSAIIYGANASGKSNLVKAINFARDVVLLNLDNIETNKKYFRLNASSSKKPSRFEFEIEINGAFFSYGFSLLLQNKKVEEEWLYEIGKSKPEKIFARVQNKIDLGAKLNKKKNFLVYASDMLNQSSQLFLSEIGRKKLEFESKEKSIVLNEIFDWFENKLIFIYPDSRYERSQLLANDSDLISILKKHLIEFDTGISDLSLIKENFEKSLNDIPPQVKKDIEKKLLGTNQKKTHAILEGSNGELYAVFNEDNELVVKKLGLKHGKKFHDIFEFKDESDGTRRLFDLIPLLKKFDEDITVVIDEFDRSLHPKLTKKFFELFYSHFIDSKSQLLVTTHESTLLDLDLVRRDEIHFVEKDDIGASAIFSLNQFKVRYDKKIDKAYLLGRYGAIPIFKSFDEM